jgi:hypothetical protein
MKSKIKKYAESTASVRLSSHEKLCAERMKQLIKSVDKIEKNIAELQDNVSKGKGAVAVLFGLGSIVIAALGFIQFK